ncbi:MAG TPA: DUF4265 domain-containing protein [Burkholderiaceae bacterium]
MEKVRFKLDSEDWHGHSLERMWAKEVLGSDRLTLFQVQNSPFFAKGVSFLDVVSVLRDEDGEYVFDEVVEKSGHSTLILLVPIESKAAFYADCWPEAETLGCTYESGEIELSFGLAEMLSVDVLPTADRHTVRDWLVAGERASVFHYQESDLR